MIDCAAACESGPPGDCVRDCVWAEGRRRPRVSLLGRLGSDVEPEVLEPGPVIEMYTTPDLDGPAEFVHVLVVDTDPFDAS